MMYRVPKPKWYEVDYLYEYTAGTRVAHWQDGRAGTVVVLDSWRRGKVWIKFDDNGKQESRWCHLFSIVNPLKRSRSE